MTGIEDNLTTRWINRRSCLLGAAGLVAGPAAAPAGETSRPVPPSSDPSVVAVVGSKETQDWFEAIPGERMRVRIGGSDSGGTLSVLESIVAPKAATLLHYHAAAEIFLIMSGRLRLVCGGRGQDLDAGSSAVVPAGAHHGFVNLSGEPVRMLAVFAPGGIERLFIQLAGTPPGQWSDLARRFDTVIVGPPVTG